MVGKFLKSSSPLTKYKDQNLRCCAHSRSFQEDWIFKFAAISSENFEVSHIKAIFLDIE